MYAEGHGKCLTGNQGGDNRNWLLLGHLPPNKEGMKNSFRRVCPGTRGDFILDQEGSGGRVGLAL